MKFSKIKNPRSSQAGASKTLSVAVESPAPPVHYGCCEKHRKSGKAGSCPGEPRGYSQVWVQGEGSFEAIHSMPCDARMSWARQVVALATGRDPSGIEIGFGFGQWDVRPF